ncbi:hypothetical protein [Prevotella denticola]|uniref:hypothetical protein n=1 Tax=Prevotella denticola TaxID=28129 RepID=UPI0028E97A17|nr:hypothetical protein [Prevotella denticola]
MRKYIFIMAVVLCTPLSAQNTKGNHSGDTSAVEPIESVRLQGPREATEAEKAYARRLAEDRAQQAQIDSNLPLIAENGQTVTPGDFYYPGWGYGFGAWRLHEGLNVNLSASAFAGFGHGNSHGAGFSQDVSLMYVTNLSKKATLAVGGYVNHLTYRSGNYFVGGVNAVLGYQFNEHWSAYAFVQKAFTSDNFGQAFGYGSPYWYSYGAWGYAPIGYGFAPMAYEYAPMGWGYGAVASRFMDRIGGGVTYQWGAHNQNSISVNVEFDHVPTQRNGYYNTRRYDYPVR